MTNLSARHFNYAASVILEELQAYDHDASEFLSPALFHMPLHKRSWRVEIWRVATKKQIPKPD